MRRCRWRVRHAVQDGITVRRPEGRRGIATWRASGDSPLDARAKSAQNRKDVECRPEEGKETVSRGSDSLAAAVGRVNMLSPTASAENSYPFLSARFAITVVAA